ncbi:hypothetical protein PU849_21720 [Shigella dysenteriae]|uniref:hypothetical protein n=1 Tax=Shigella dysenteriae TaxID=622 RepID=UPI0013048D41|nr:hypothetical protein [Shigella dysenteriae]MDS1497229.1 hypothetical protein [Shigella dysenteriae]
MTTEMNAKGEEVVIVFTPYITRGGKRIFKKDGCRFNWSTQQLCENMGLRRFFE